MQEISTTANPWSIYCTDISMVSLDGSVRPLYNRETSIALSHSGNSTGTASVNHLSGEALSPDTTTTFYHGDHLGSSRIMSSVNGYPVWQATYLPFGYEYNPQITVNHFKFTGKERDSESNLDNFGARYFASTMGRFMTPDLDNSQDDPPDPVPYGDRHDPQTLNLYSYVRNNPLNRIDPDGHKLVCTSSTSMDEKGNMKVITNCHEEPDPPPPSSPSIIDQIRAFFGTEDPEAKTAIGAGIVGDILHGGNAGNLNDVLPSAETDSNAPGPPTVPLKVLKLLDAVDAASSTAQGGKDFKNDGRGGGPVLPPTDGQGNAITYTERDVNATPSGGRRDAERIVTGSDGSAYYTPDHYKTFTKIR